MKLSAVKQALAQLPFVRFKLPDQTYVSSHFHVTEVGLITKHFVDCGGVERLEKVVNFQLWQAEDYDHRLAPQKFLRILDVAQKIFGHDDELEVEVEYQQETIGKFGLEFDGHDFVLTSKQTACLARDHCGIPQQQIPKKIMSNCSPAGGCC